MTLPSSLQTTLWSKSLEKIDQKKDKIYIVHQILALGSLEEITRLFKTYKKEAVQDTFLNHPRKIYTKSQLNFVKEILLGYKPKVDENKFLKNPF